MTELQAIVAGLASVVSRYNPGVPVWLYAVLVALMGFVVAKLLQNILGWALWIVVATAGVLVAAHMVGV